ncbi:hypothetical protein CR513_58839, partial [Mucuna pruriens]
MENVPYAYAIESLMFVQVCTHPDIIFVISDTKEHFLIYKRYDHLKTFTTTSTMEAKYVAYCDAICQAMWLKKFTFEFHLVDSIPKPLTIYCDNFLCISPNE